MRSQLKKLNLRFLFLFFCLFSFAFSAGYINVNVKDRAGNNLSAARIDLFDSLGVWQAYFSPTDVNGNFSIWIASGSEGNYYLKVSKTGFMDQWYNEAWGDSDKTPVTIAGSDVNVNFRLYPSVTLTGTIKDNAGTGLSGVQINAFFKYSGFTWVSQTFSGVGGAYSLNIPANLNVMVRAEPANTYFTTFYGQAYGEDDATTLNLAVGGAGYDITLQTISTINGHVQNNSAVALANVDLMAFDRDTNFKYLNSVTTNASGDYTMTVPSNINVLLRSSANSYMTIYYNQAQTTTNSTPINLVSQTTNNVDFTMYVGRTLSGSVTGPGSPTNIRMVLFDTSEVYIAETTANAGAYSFSNLIDGFYYLKAEDPAGGYYDQFWNTGFGSSDREVVTINSNTSGINFPLYQVATLNGFIRRDTGAILAAVTVSAYERSSAFRYVNEVTSNASGYFTMRVPAGFNMMLKASTSNAIYDDTFYVAGSDWSTSTVINLSAGQTFDGSITMNGNAAITGVIRDSNNQPILNAVVTAFSHDGLFTYYDRDYTDAGGNYALSIPPMTNLLVQAVATGCRTTFYNNATDWQSAVTFNLVTGATSANCNIILPKTWTITGNVNLAGGANPTGSLVEVFAYNDWTTFIGSTTVTASGYYEILGSNDANIMVRFSNGSYVTMLYPSLTYMSNITIANRITVVSGNVYGLNTVTLNAGGTVAGTITVTGATGPCVSINIEDRSGAYFTSVTINAAGGAYSIPRIPAGNNWIVKALEQGLVAEYYGETASTSNATTVNVSGGATTSGVNISIAQPWVITGSVTILGSGLPVVGARIEAYVYPAGGTWAYVDSATTNALGVYTIANGYNATNVFVRAQAAGYADQFYNNKAFYSDVSVGDFLAMTPGSTTTNINFVVYNNGTINGTVTSSVGGATLANVLVKALRASDNAWIAEVTTNALGNYSLSVIPGEILKLVLTKTAYATANPTTTYNISSGAVINNVNHTLTPFWRVGGRVTLSDAHTPVNVLVTLFENGNSLNIIATANPNSSGYYEFVSMNVPSTPNMALALALVNYQSASFNAIAVSLGITDVTTFNVVLTSNVAPTPIPAGQSIKDTIMSGPNPANPDKGPVHIGFIVDVNSTAKVRIYTLGGELVYENSKTCSVGYNEFPWTADDLYGDKVPNGVYLAYVEIDTGSEKIKKVVKIAILR